MDNQHFVYAIKHGTHDANGTPIIIFGKSSTKSFYNRFQVYNSCSPTLPILLGVILCEDERHARDVEKAVLSRTASDIFPDASRKEIRKATDDVLGFIETEMEDGEAFLGMPAHEYARLKDNAYRLAQMEDPERKENRRKNQRDWVRNLYQTDSNFRDKERKRSRDRQRELWKDPAHRDRQKELYQERMKNPEQREKKRQYDRLWGQRKKRGGNSPGQQTLF